MFEHQYVMLMACGNNLLGPLYDAHGNGGKFVDLRVAVNLLKRTLKRSCHTRWIERFHAVYD